MNVCLVYSTSECCLQIVGADEDNMLLTRRMQRDLWVHQHPKDCNDPNLKFVYLDFQNDHNIGLGAQIHAIEGVMGDAIAEGKIVVLGHFKRAEHGGCRGERVWWTLVQVILTQFASNMEKLLESRIIIL
jgi:hypothetical protein